MTSLRIRTSLSSPQRYSYDGELKKAVDIADHYGFKLLNPLAIEKEDRDNAERHGCLHEQAAIIRMINADESYKGLDTLLFAHTRKVPYKNKLELHLDVIGDKESSAEGLLLQATKEILRDYGHEDTLVAVNSVGGRETTSSFTQAVNAFLRGRISDLDPECRDGIRKSAFAPLRCSHQACIDVRASAPQSLNYLSEQSKQHFKEVLEYLESLDMPYVIDPSLVGSEHYTTRTVFAIGTPAIATSEHEATEAVAKEACVDPVSQRHFSNVLAWGERLDQLSKKLGAKKPIPAVHATIDLNTASTKERYSNASAGTTPQAYVVQVGFPAKIQTLRMNEDLRKAKIRVSVTLHKQSVTEQMDYARIIGAPYIVIIGHKEVKDGAALIRHVHTNHQEAVPFSGLPSYLKTIYATKKR